MSDTRTNVQQTTVSEEALDNLLGFPGADSIMTPGTEQKSEEPEKPGFFSTKTVDTSFVDQDSDLEEEEEPTGGDDTPPAGGDQTQGGEIDNFLSEVDQQLLDEEEDDDDDDSGASKPGRKPLDKDGMAQLAQKLIEEKVILPFEDDKDLSEYTMEDYLDLFKVNIEERERQVKESTPAEFFQSLPPQLQYAAKYVADGGQDLKGLFAHLARAEETRNLDPGSERGQEQIVRDYLRATNFGTDEDIQEEIETWKDLDKLEEKAMKFKPKLDAMQEQVVQRQLAEQEHRKKQQEEASYRYMENVYNTLEKGELNGLKLNPKTQNMLYSGLVQPNYPSISGKETNLFGHLIEKYQFVEPNHELIAEALWLLADPDGYRGEIRKNVQNDTVKDTVKKLKTEQQSRASGQADSDTGGGRRSQGIPRPSKNFFKR